MDRGVVKCNIGSLVKNSYYFVVGIFFLIIVIPIIGLFNKFDFDLVYFTTFFQSKYNIRIIYVSFIQAFLSSIISCIIAIPFALSLFRQKKNRINKLLISLSGYSFVLPPILIVYSFIGIYGLNGILNKLTNFYNFFEIKTLFGLKAILIAHILLNTPFATRMFFQNLNSMPKSYIDVAKSMNFGFFQNLINLEWPLIKQNFFTVFSIIFILCFLSFAIVMALGGGPRYSTMEVAIYQSVFFELNFNKAIILSLIQIIICLIFIVIGFFNLRGSNYFDIQTEQFEYLFSKNKIIRFCDYIIILLFSLFLFSPILYIFYNFLFNLINTKFFLNINFIKAFINSLFLCIISGFLVSFYGFLISLVLVNSRNKIFHQQILFIFSSIIIIISPIIISLGYFIILGELRYINLVNYFIIILINCIFLIPFSILILFTKLKNIFLNFHDIKEGFRINDKKFIFIIFPLIKKNIFFVFSFASALSFGDFTIISFFKNDSFQTLPTLLYKLISAYKFNEASFVAGFILIFSLFIYLLFDNWFYKDKPDRSM